ncbi:hypothetical protein BS17DRAFT_305964 [Gyrodon lividus]|nr:hypothetical protein BS17DRAFT_314393 [Gyrodon lividus]KAF9218155.1 hypothetical protein BS17DRAFT_305964 [Gyrodon lividus]
MMTGSSTSPETGEDTDEATISGRGDGDELSGEVDSFTGGDDGLRLSSCSENVAVGTSIEEETGTLNGGLTLSVACAGSEGRIAGTLLSLSLLFRRMGGIFESPSISNEYQCAHRKDGHTDQPLACELKREQPPCHGGSDWRDLIAPRLWE